MDLFLTSRQEKIKKELRQRVGGISVIETKMEDDPNGLIDDTEEKIRLLINKTLSVKNSDYWEALIPQGIKEKVKEDKNKATITNHKIRNFLVKTHKAIMPTTTIAIVALPPEKNTAVIATKRPSMTKNISSFFERKTKKIDNTADSDAISPKCLIWI